MPTVSTSKHSMKVDSIEDFCQAYKSDPDAALAALKGLNDQQAAAILIDAGGVLSDKSLLDDGIARLEKLPLAESESSYRSYCIANGRHLRASIEQRRGSPLNDDVLEDLFQARIEHSKVMSNKQGSAELRSQSATNIGNVLLETGRWVEALDFFQKARSEWRRNGVAALREMQCLMGFCNAARDNPERFDVYSDRGQLRRRIFELSRIVESTYAEIRKLAGESAVDHAMHAVSQVESPGADKERRALDPFFEFIKDGNLALSLFCSPGQYERQKIDILTFECISDDDWKSTAVPEIFAMLNVMKSDYALARQVFYEARFDDCETVFHETVKSGDTLDYSIYGVQASALCCAQRISYDILDKISVALSGYLGIGNAKRKTFDSLWYKYKDRKKAGLNETIEQALKDGNRGLLALYDLHRDTTMESSENPGFLQVFKRYRNSSTHRFTVLYDETLGIDRTSRKFVDREHATEFEGLTLSTIRLARAALFYFCDAINFAEDCRPATPNTMKLTDIVPDHDYMRGRDLKN